jgi:hypothetical protein
MGAFPDAQSLAALKVFCPESSGPACTTNAKRGLGRRVPTPSSLPGFQNRIRSPYGDEELLGYVGSREGSKYNHIGMRARATALAELQYHKICVLVELLGICRDSGGVSRQEVSGVVDGIGGQEIFRAANLQRHAVCQYVVQVNQRFFLRF